MGQDESQQELKMAEFLVGIGASAGGLQALQDFFNNMSSVEGIAFVVIQHLSPDFKSLMNQLLSNFTKMKIKIVENNMPVERDTIYLIPPKNNMIVENKTLFLAEQERGYHLNFPINIFFKSLAKDYSNKAIAIILSGTGSDGSDGIMEVASAGGLIIVQEPENAQFDGMPRSAINTKVVNKVLAADKIPSFISSFLQNPIQQKEAFEKEEYSHTEDVYTQIFKVLNKKIKVDFSEYKESTIFRRIDRRAKTLLIPSVEDYAKYLYENSDEVDLLYNDLLIGVTSFFRDKESFEILKKDIIPDLFENKEETRQLRIWIPACSSGEEAYSFAILFKEQLDVVKKAYDIKIFASDLSKNMLNIAAQGSYSETSLLSVSKERRDRFFMKKGDRYFVIPEIRNMIVFAPQNINTDPPFTNIDFISCRNFLIYIKPEVQKRIIATFYFSLNKNGILFLGSSEGINDFGSEFFEINRTHKIYRKNFIHKVTLPFNSTKLHLSNTGIDQSTTKIVLKNSKYFISKIYDFLLEEYLPDSIVIDSDEEILHITGIARDFLKIQKGRVSNNILRQIHEDLRSTITSGIHKAQHEGKILKYKNNIIKKNGAEFSVDLSIRPLHFEGEATKIVVITFEHLKEELPENNKVKIYEMGSSVQLLVQDLEIQLQTTKENLQAALEEAETTNEELQSTNEELLASNEELQSTNEELHSVNEELYTVNAEFQRKISELETLEDDIDNLIHSTGIGTIFLDENICIRKITPAISENYNILSHDIGRSIETFAINFNNEELIKKIKNVQKLNIVEQIETIDLNGKSTLIKIMPYIGTKNKRGIVISFIDITVSKKMESKLFSKTKELEQTSQQVSDIAELTSKDLKILLSTINRELKSFHCPVNNINPQCNVNSIFDISKKFEGLVNSLENISKIKNEKLEITEISLELLFIELMEHFTKKYPEVKIDKIGNFAILKSDRRIVYQVFYNLFENAIKFNSSKVKKIKISLIETPKEIIFSISDNGMGIPSKKDSQMFKLFSVLNKNDNINDLGEGVGLVLSKMALDRVDGNIWYTSEEEVGSVFYVSFPLTHFIFK